MRKPGFKPHHFLQIGAYAAWALSPVFNTASVPERGVSARPAARIATASAPPKQDPVELSLTAYNLERVPEIRAGFAATKWNGCFTDVSGKTDIPYNPKTVRALRVSINSPRRTDHNRAPIIVIDPGHGHQAATSTGYDPGAVSNGLREVDAVDAIAGPLQKSLKRRGAHVIMTRTPLVEGISLNPSSAKKISLQKRAEFATDLQARFPENPVLFISLHGDEGASRPRSVVYYYEGNSRTSPSAQLAASISHSYKLHAQSRTSVNAGDYGVLRCQYERTPAVLIELGYLNNESDRTAFKKAIAKPHEAARIAESIARGVDDYLALNRASSTQMAALAP